MHERTVTGERPFNQKQMRAIHAVFGDAGTNLAKDIIVRIIIGDTPSHTMANVDTGEIVIFMNSKPWRKCVPSAVHEFTHFYHNYFWLEESSKCPPENHEACAIYAETILAARLPQYKSRVEKRLQAVRNHPFDFYRKAMVRLNDSLPKLKTLSVHAGMEYLLKDYVYGAQDQFIHGADHAGV